MEENFNELNIKKIRDIALNTIMQEKQVAFSTIDKNHYPSARII